MFGSSLLLCTSSCGLTQFSSYKRPFYFQVESFLEVLHEADQSLADTLEKRFPSLKLQT